MPKQASSFILEVEFDTDLDDVEKIEFVFAQHDYENSEIYKYATWINGSETPDVQRCTGENKIDIHWTREETFLFERDEYFFMDTRIKFIGSDTNPITPIITLRMCPSLFKANEDDE